MDWITDEGGGNRPQSAGDRQRCDHLSRGLRPGATDCQPPSETSSGGGKRWRGHLPRLAALGLPLLPCGAGAEKKAPIDARTGELLTGWPTASFTVEQLLAMNGVVRSVGTRTGTDAHGLLAFDIDGPTALELALEHGCDPQEAQTWQVHRDTDPCRLKVCWRLTAEQSAQLGDISTKAHTRLPVKDANGQVLEKGEALEVFHHPGRQIVVLGEHPSSGGRYLWPEGKGPETLALIPPAWWSLALKLQANVLGLQQQQAASKRNSKSSSSDEWRPADPCPICGRDTTGYCSRNRDSGTIRCFHGSTFSPEIHGLLAVGDTITGRDGITYGYCGAEPQANGDVFSTFRVHQPRSPRTPEPDPLAGFNAYASTAGDPTPAEARKRTYRELIADTLDAIRKRDVDAEMENRAEIIGRFRRSDAQINAELFRLLTSQEGGNIEATYGAIDANDLEPMSWLVDGFIPANDQVLLYGEAGAGKTTAALALAFAVIDGQGLLDRTAPVTPGKVLFIASDSGGGPLMELIYRSSYESHPAMTDGRFQIWAHSKKDQRLAWDASIAGCLALLEAIQTEGFSLVLIDSCKTVTTKADLEYTSNPQVTALLTFFTEVVCRYCSVVWLNHDGTGKGMHAGAKAWREIPSMVHAIERVYLDGGEDGQGKWASDRMRCWIVRKCRMGAARDFQYEMEAEGGRLQLCGSHAKQVVGDCTEAVLAVLGDALDRGRESLTTQELVDACLFMGAEGFAEKTVKNTLTKLVRSRVLTRPGRGRYGLSPKQKSLKGVTTPREDFLENEVRDWDLAKSRQSPSGLSSGLSPDDESPKSRGPNGVGTKANPSQREAFGPLSSRDGLNPSGEPATDAPADSPITGLPVWADQLEALAVKNPTATPYQLANLLAADGPATTPARIAQVLELLKRREAEFWEEEAA